jgi:hypothetical protein
LKTAFGARHEYHFVVINLRELFLLQFKLFWIADVGVRLQNVLEQNAQSLFVISVDTHQFEEVKKYCLDESSVVLIESLVDVLFQLAWVFACNVEEG